MENVRLHLSLFLSISFSLKGKLWNFIFFLVIPFYEALLAANVAAWAAFILSSLHVMGDFTYFIIVLSDFIKDKLCATQVAALSHYIISMM